MRDLRTISSVITDIYELLDKRFSFATTARAVKLAVEDINLYSKSQIGFRSEYLTVKDNLTAEIPSNWGDITKVSSVSGNTLFVLDRADLMPFKETYSSRKTEIEKYLDPNEIVDTELIPSAFSSEQNNSEMIFYNATSIGSGCLLGSYIANHGEYRIDNVSGLIYFSGNVPVNSLVLVEHKILTNGASYQLIPKAAFDVIFHKAQSYLEPSNTNHETLFRSYKKRFDSLGIREKYSLEEITRALTKK